MSKKESYLSYIEKLNRDTQQELEDTAYGAMYLFKVDKKLAGKELADEVYKIVEQILSTGIFPDEYDSIEDVAVALGVLFGEALCSGYGWKWREFGNSKEEAIIGVVSPEEYYCSALMSFILKISPLYNFS